MSQLSHIQSLFIRLISQSKNYRKLPKKSYNLVLLNSLTVTLLVLAVRQLGWMQPLELKTYDLFVRLKGNQQLDSRMLLVTVTESDIKNIGQLPLSDRIIAQILAELQKYQPAAIGLDIYRDLPVTPGNKQLVTQFQAPNIIAIQKIKSAEIPGVEPPPSVPLERVGFNDLLLDKDGVVRRQLMFASEGNERYFSFSLQVALLYLKRQGIKLENSPENRDKIILGKAVFVPLVSNDGGYVNSDHRGYQILINYKSSEKVARKVSLTELLNGEIEESWVKDKIVLIGTTAPSAKDLFLTPYSPAETEEPKMSGVEIQAQIVSQIVTAALPSKTQIKPSDNFLFAKLSEFLANFSSLFWFWPEWVETIWIGSWSLVGGLLAWRVAHPVKIGLLFTVSNGILWAISFVLFLLGGWVPLVPAALGLVVSGMGVIAWKQLYYSLYDSLTGLPNQQLFLNSLKRKIDYDKLPALDLNVRKNQLYASSENNLIGVLYVDLDRFKAIDDCFGRATSDRLLIGVVKKMQNCLSNNDILARISIDEFAIKLDPIKDVESAIEVAKKINKALQKPFYIGDTEVTITACIGIVSDRNIESKASTILRNARIAMYRAKVRGPGNYQVFKTAMHADAVERLQLESDLIKGIRREEFLLYYQPLICLKSGKIRGFEALIRWQHPTEGLVTPWKFIPVAEETGLIVPMGEWVLKEGSRQLKVWQEKFQFDPPLIMSINLSGKQLSQPDIFERIKEIIEASGVEAENVKLEITESVIMEDVKEAIALLNNLKSLNLKLGIDDFGTGYSSLSYLNSFPTDTLKVDKSFVSQMEIEGNGTNTSIVRTIINLAHLLGMDIIAEGIETKEQLEKLRLLGCEYGQGYFFAKPLPSAEAEALLESDPRYL